jgi:hypothetical protein
MCSDVMSQTNCVLFLLRLLQYFPMYVKTASPLLHTATFTVAGTERQGPRLGSVTLKHILILQEKMDKHYINHVICVLQPKHADYSGRAV